MVKVKMSIDVNKIIERQPNKELVVGRKRREIK